MLDDFAMLLMGAVHGGGDHRRHRSSGSPESDVARIGSGLYWLVDYDDLRVYLDIWRPFAFAAIMLGVGLLAALLIAPRYSAELQQSQSGG
jgi:hypothetical protein